MVPRACALVAALLLALGSSDPAWSDGISGAYTDNNPLSVDPGDVWIDRLVLSTLNSEGVSASVRITYDPLGLARLVDATEADAGLFTPGSTPVTTDFGISAGGVTEWSYLVYGTTGVLVRYEVPTSLTPELAESYSQPYGRGSQYDGFYFIELQIAFNPIGEYQGGGFITITQGVNFISGLVVSSAPSPVPEPASLGLLGFGLALFIARRRGTDVAQASRAERG